MKGILLAGGTGTRLFPATVPVSKQLLPVYDKPLIYYPLTTLMLAGISEVLVITTEQDMDQFRLLLRDGSQWGLDITYAVQSEARGIPEALLIGRDFIGDDSVALALGDNIFFGYQLTERLRRASTLSEGALIFAHTVPDPERFGVVTLDRDGGVIEIVEKPKHPESNLAVVGLYFYDRHVADHAADLNPSARGELEITDLNRGYLERGELRAELLGRGTAWIDAGTADSLLQAANFIQNIEKQQGMQVASPEEIAWRLGYIDDAELGRQADAISSSAYGQYLRGILDQYRSGAQGPDDYLQVHSAQHEPHGTTRGTDTDRRFDEAGAGEEAC